jgi:hypothetical protein
VANVDWAVAIGAGAVPLLEILLLVGRKPHARTDSGSGECILDYGPRLKAFAIFAVGFFSFIGAMYVWTFLTASAHGGLTLTLILVVWGSLLLLSTILGLEMFRSYCRFSSAQITRQSPWTGRLSIVWEEVDSITYDNFAQWYIVRSPRGKIRLHTYLNGLGDFLAIAKTRVPPERWGRG